MSERFDELVSIMDRLRGEGGCPWDREQSFEDVLGHIRGELDEVVEAVRSEDGAHVEEELGDLLFTVVFAVRLGRERGWLSMDSVLAGICEKLIRRHPHIFGDEPRQDLTAEQVLEQWERIKAEEKRGR